jgi:pyruvate kinase
MTTKRTKIVCTLGPASSKTETLVKMIRAGMNVARLNFSHGSYESQAELIKNLRQAEKLTGKTIAIIQDLQGPKIRIGLMPDNGISIKLGEKFLMDTSKDKYRENDGQKIVPVQYRHLHQDVSKGDIILIEDGMIKTSVESVKGTVITVKALTPGLLKSHKGINVPTASISADPLTDKDLKDLLFGIKAGVDFVALSFVRKASDITRLREILLKHKSYIKIIAKIERHEALDNIEDIIRETNAVMVARGDLGVETPAEAVPIAQKHIVKLALEMGKPVIIATEMLQSMIENPRATRAEISDAANAVFDHADALMLSNETATGKYPVQAVQTLAKVATNIEKFQQIHNWTKLKLFRDKANDPIEICHTATLLAEDTGAKMIVTITDHGYTTRHVSNRRTYHEIVVISPYRNTRRELQLCWGIEKIVTTKLRSPDSIATLLLKEKLIKKGDKIVIVSNASTKNRQITLKLI